jgi:hypothetical protein
MSGFTERFARRENVVASRYEDGDRVVFVADLGGAAEVSADVVDGTAIVVHGDEQYEFAVPDGDATVTVNNGVVTVEVRR